MDLTQRNIILYQAYGKRYINQTIFSIITLINIYEKKLLDFKILVYTDQPEAFNDLSKAYNVQAIFIPESKREEWAGKEKFILRSKILAPLELLGSNSNLNVLQVDSDTFFTRKVGKLFSMIETGKLVMHLKEQSIAYIRKKWHPSFYPPNVDQKLTDGLHLTLNDETFMWNSGVIGISNKNKQLLQHVLNLTDSLYDQYPNWLIEQLAYTTVFTATKSLIESKRFIFHYYHYKPTIDIYIEKKLQENYGLNTLIDTIKLDNLVRKVILRHYYDYLYFHLRDLIRNVLGREEIFKRK
jgi:hypothetical protein